MPQDLRKDGALRKRSIMTNKYTKKSIPVEAVQWRGDNLDEVMVKMNKKYTKKSITIKEALKWGSQLLKTKAEER